MNLNPFVFLYISLLFILKVNCEFQIKKIGERVYEVYDQMKFVAYLRFKFVNVAVLIEIEWSDDASSDVQVEFVLKELSQPNTSIVLKARKQLLTTETTLYLQRGFSESDEVELDCKYYSLVNKPTANKLVVKLGPILRFFIKNDLAVPVIVNNNVRNVEINFYKLNFFGQKKMETRKWSDYSLVFNKHDDVEEDLFCLKGADIERSSFVFESTSFGILIAVLIALIVLLVFLTIYYIVKVRKYRITI